MNSGKIVAGRVDGTGRKSKVLQEVLADLKVKFLSNISKAGTGGRTPAMEIAGDHLWSRCDLS